jgi:hypothetical protein
MTCRLKNNSLPQLFLLLLLTALSFGCSQDQKVEDTFQPVKKVTKTTTTSNSDETIIVGTGWGEGTPEKAIKSALTMALKDESNQSPDLVIIHPTAGSDSQRMLQIAKEIVGNSQVYGGTSDARGVVSNLNYLSGTKKGYSSATEKNEPRLNRVAVMTLKTDEITFGAGSAALSECASAQEMAKVAYLKALKNAGKEISDKPAVLLVTPTIGIEHEVLKGLKEVAGEEVVLLGGTAGGPNGVVIGTEGAYEKGVSIALFFTDLPVGWVFEAGFEKQDKYSGIVTKMNGQQILEIDNEPAYLVYDRWLAGEVTRRMEQEGGRSGKFRDYLGLHPLFRKRVSPDGKSYSIFSHPWAPNKELITSGLNTTTDIKVGERVYLSYGTWEILLNRIGSLPSHARQSIGLAENSSVAFAIGTICAGVMGVIPEDERQKFPVLINHANGNAPFIANITWGEQGALPGVGYQHCNLTTSFLVIGKKSN